MPRPKNIFPHLCFFILTFGICSAEAQNAYPRYDIKATVDAAEKKLTAQQKVIYSNNSPDELSEIYFHIYPNREYSLKEKKFMSQYAGYFKVNLFPEGFQTGVIRFHSTEVEGVSVTPILEGEDKTILKVPLATPLEPGGEVELTLNYTVDIPHSYGRFGWHEDMMRLSRWYPILSVYDDQGWNNHPFYPFHRPFFSDSSIYNVELTVPENQVVIHSGERAKEQNNNDGTKTLLIETPDPVREFSFAMGPQYRVLEDNFDTVKIKSYYLPGHEFYAKNALQSAKDLMAFFTARFGPYPYKEFSIAPVHLGYGGEQMSNVIFIDSRTYELPGFSQRWFDFLIAHETGHQWFYNMVGMDEFNEMWLEEGVNSYFITIYLDEKYPDGDVIAYPDWFKDWKWTLPDLKFKSTRDVRYKTLVRYGYDRPIVGKLSSFQEPSSIFSLTYGKGSRVVGMLREKIGAEAFDRVFRRMFQEYKWKNISIKEFQRLSEEESGQDLDDFFHTWLYDARVLNYAVTKVEGNKITFVNKGEIISPTKVRVTLKNGQKHDLLLDIHKKKETIDTGLPGKIQSVVIDPDESLLDIDRTNNAWPRKIHVKAVPLYLPLYDIPVFLPDDGYNVVVGPEIAPNGLGVKTSFQKPYDYITYGATSYDFADSIHTSRAGFQLNNFLHTQTALGAEVSNRTDLDDGSEDLVTQKIYLRRELWPAKYSILDINDHASLYVIRNRGVDGFLVPGEREDSRNISYLRRDEAIAGVNFHLGRSGPSLDPAQGYIVDTMFENSGHFWGATQHFTRGAVDTSFYHPVTLRSKMAYRVKAMGGFPYDKNLFELGGPNGLRGHDRKSLRGSKAFLGSVEYRFPLIEKINWRFFDNILGLESISGVVFMDAGQNWFGNFNESSLKRDVGGGLRFTMNIASFVEKVIVRIDAGQALNEPKEETQFWFGVNHAF